MEEKGESIKERVLKPFVKKGKTEPVNGSSSNENQSNKNSDEDSNYMSVSSNESIKIDNKINDNKDLNNKDKQSEPVKEFVYTIDDDKHSLYPTQDISSLYNKKKLDDSLNGPEIEEKVQKSKKQTIKEVIVEWSTNTTAHGFGNISRTSNLILKVLWTFFLLLSISYCLFLIITNIMLFYNYNVNTATTIIYEAPAEFPAISICNLNPYDGGIIRNRMNELLIEKNVSSESFDEAIRYVNNASDILQSNIELLASQGELDLFYAGFWLQQMLISCKYEGELCSYKNFLYFHDYYYGSCYRFNYGRVGMSPEEEKDEEVRQATSPGWKNGLQLELYVGDPKIQQQFTYKTGVRIIVHNKSLVPFPDEDGIDVSTGKQTNIAISRTFSNRLPAPFSDCIDKWEKQVAEKNRVLKTLYNLYDVRVYTQKYCLKACLQNYIILKCNCYDLGLLKPNNSTNTKACTEIIDLTCQEEADLEFYKPSSNFLKKCYESCPGECNSIAYDYRTSHANYPTEWYAEVLNNKTSFTDLFDETPTFAVMQQTILMVNIYYSEMKYTLIEESQAYTFDELIANIGGNAGLFVGISVLSLAEIVEVVFYIIYLTVIKK